MKVHTLQSIKTLILSRMEDNLPDRILAALEDYDGKAITTRLERGLNSAIPNEEFSLHREYGWTALTNKSYRTSQGNKGIKFILARSEKSVPLDCKWVEMENPAWFSGRRERNALRIEALRRDDLLAHMAHLLNVAEDARATLQAVEDEVNLLTSHQAPLSPERYVFRNLLAGKETRNSPSTGNMVDWAYPARKGEL